MGMTTSQKAVSFQMVSFGAGLFPGKRKEREKARNDGRMFIPEKCII